MAVETRKPPKPSTLPRGRKAQAALAGSAKKELTQAVGHQVREMREDYQVQFGRLVLTANLSAVPVTVSVENGDARAEALGKHLETLWKESFNSMHDAYDYGRVAFEKCWGADTASGLTTIEKLEPLPYEKTEMLLSGDGEYAGVRLKGTKTVDILACDSWWLALDATSLEPHGRSRFSGAPHRVYKDRREALKMRGIFLKRFALGWLKGHVNRVYEDPQTGENVDAMEAILNAIDDMRGGGSLLFGNERVKKLDGTEGDYQEDVELMETPDKIEPVESSITAMDSEQLQAMGIPPKTVIEGEAVGSYAMVTQQMRVLFAVVDDILSQMVKSFQRYVIDKLVELNFADNLPTITISYPPLTERPDSLIVEIVKAILTSGQVSPLISEGGIDIKQMLEDAGIPVTPELDALIAEPSRIRSVVPSPLQPGSTPSPVPSQSEKPTGPDGKPVDNVSQTALNGAQITSLLEIVTALVTGQLPASSAYAVMSSAFPSMSRQQVDAILKPLIGFTPDSAPSTPAKAFHLANEPFNVAVPTRREMIDDALDALSDLYADLVNAVVNRHSAKVQSIQETIRKLQGSVTVAGHILGMVSPWRPAVNSAPAGAIKQKPIRLALEDDGYAFPWLADALSFLNSKQLMTPEQFEELDRDERAAAFSVPGVDDSQVLADIRASISDSLRDGEGLREFRSRIEDTVALNRAQTETLFRTNTKQSYIAGMERTLSDPAVQEVFPYVQFAATSDTRVRDSHWELDGMVVKRGTPEHQLMLRALSDYNCRCALIPLSIEDGERAGVKTMQDISSEARKLYA